MIHSHFTLCLRACDYMKRLSQHPWYGLWMRVEGPHHYKVAALGSCLKWPLGMSHLGVEGNQWVCLMWTPGLECQASTSIMSHSLTSWNSREWIFVVQISLFIVTLSSLISQNLLLMQTIKEVNPRLHITPCVNMWSVFFFFFFFFFFLLHVGA
jgi:hypothetical protein